MKDSFNSLVSVLAMLAVCWVVVWIANGTPMQNIGTQVYTGEVQVLVDSLGMSAKQLMVGVAICLVLVVATTSLGKKSGKESKK